MSVIKKHQNYAYDLSAYLSINVLFQFEAVVTPGNELMVHHIILYRCKGIPASYDRAQGFCYEKSRPLPQCYDVILAWAIGGRVMI